MCELASLRFSFDGDRRPAKTQNTRQMQSPFFPYAARFMSRGCVPGFYPIHKEAYEQEAKQDIVTDRFVEEERQKAISDYISVKPESIDTGTITPVEEKLLPKPVASEPDKQIIDEPLKEDKSPNKNTEDKDNNVNVSEKIIALLDKSELGLNNVKTQVGSVKSLFEEIMYKLDSYISILDIIYNNEDRRINSPQASIAGQKESKDTIDEILELLQNPAIQSVLRQFMVGIIGKSSTKPES